MHDTTCAACDGELDGTAIDATRGGRVPKVKPQEMRTRRRSVGMRRVIDRQTCRVDSAIFAACTAGPACCDVTASAEALDSNRSHAVRR